MTPVRRRDGDHQDVEQTIGLTHAVAAARMETMETTATETGEAQMAIWEATDATAMGRSGRMFFCSAMSAMMGNMV